jgi:hypothetical protein
MAKKVAVANISMFEKHGLIGTFVLTGICLLLSYYAKQAEWPLIFIACWGALGGIAHEFPQSGGSKFVWDKKPKDGTYMGSLAGAFAGLVTSFAGCAAWVTFANGGVVLTSGNYYEVAVMVFVAGLAVKGGFEALLGKSVPAAD